MRNDVLKFSETWVKLHDVRCVMLRENLVKIR